jgi:hypothetical protein
MTSKPEISLEISVPVEVAPYGKGWRAWIETRDDRTAAEAFADTPGEAAKVCIDLFAEKYLRGSQR